MGILTALNSAVGGLGAQSFALENVSGNIANSSTTGFKRKDTSFADLVRSNTSNPAHVTSGGVTASSRSTITLDGDIQGDKVDTHLAINGTGFFSVSADPLDNSLGPRYTRAGDFEQYYDSRNGQTYLRNGSGYSLIGINQSPAVGEDPKGPITIDKTSQSAKASTQITYKLNLPTEPVTTNSTANPTVSDANVYDPDWPTSATSATTATSAYKIANTGKVVGNEVADFLDNSVSGGTTTIYDAQGTPAVVQLRWVKFNEEPATRDVTIPATNATVTGSSLLPADGSLASLNGTSFDISLDANDPRTVSLGATEFDSTSTRADLLNVIQSKLDAPTIPGVSPKTTGSIDFSAPGSMMSLNGKSITVTQGSSTYTTWVGPSTFNASSTTADLIAGFPLFTVDAGGHLVFQPPYVSASDPPATLSGPYVSDFLGTPTTTPGVATSGGFGPGVISASIDATGHLVVTADTAGHHSLAFAGSSSIALVGSAPNSVVGADAYTVAQPNPDAGRSEWGLFYRNAETYDASNATAPVWTQISSNTSITNGKLGRTAEPDASGKLPGALGWTSTYSNTDPSGFFFDTNGKQLDSTSALAISNLTINGKNFGDLTLNMAATEFADKNGAVTANQLNQDGYSTGAFEGVSIDDNSGIVSYNYSNGQTVQKWKIPIVAFNGASYLKAEDGGAYTETIQSGSPIDIDGSLSSSALEASNVDISEEFTKLIVTQQAFSANSKVITTANQLMDDILQIIR